MLGFLFDLDGTLVDSHTSIEASWSTLAKEIGVVAPSIYDIHGIPASDTIKKYAPKLAGQELADFVDLMEKTEIETAPLVKPVDGALEIIDYLNKNNLPWTIVTSCTWPLAKARLDAISLYLPENSVTFDQVKRGKPDPEPFILGAERLGMPVGNCWAVEDSKGGLKSAQDAGCKTIAVLTSYRADELLGADHYVTNLMQIVELVGI